MPTLRALGLQSLNQIPDHIPTVKWGWVISGIGRAPARGGEVRMDDLFLHAAFSDRIDAGLESWNTSASVLKGKGKETAQASRGNEEFSVISCVYAFYPVGIVAFRSLDLLPF
jgi:DNA polymerase lambda